jgi:hypothetical protein
MPASIPLLFTCIFALLTPARADDRDAIVLKSGKELRGRVILELDDRVVLLVGTREMWIDRDKIQSISSIQAALRGILTRFDKAGDKPDELIALAKECAKAGLPHEQRLFYWAVLVIDPSHAVAHQELGHRQSGSTWRMPVDGSWRSLDQAERIHAEWGKARRLRSERCCCRSRCTSTGRPRPSRGSATTSMRTSPRRTTSCTRTSTTRGGRTRCSTRRPTPPSTTSAAAAEVAAPSCRVG